MFGFLCIFFVLFFYIGIFSISLLFELGCKFHFAPGYGKVWAYFCQIKQLYNTTSWIVVFGVSGNSSGVNPLILFSHSLESLRCLLHQFFVWRNFFASFGFSSLVTHFTSEIFPLNCFFRKKQCLLYPLDWICGFLIIVRVDSLLISCLVITLGRSENST